MTTISRNDAFNAVATAIEKGEYQAAQRLLGIVSDAILERKRAKRMLTEVVLRDARDEQLYVSVVDKNRKVQT